jgi:hypothetical protein
MKYFMKNISLNSNSFAAGEYTYFTHYGEASDPNTIHSIISHLISE